MVCKIILTDEPIKDPLQSGWRRIFRFCIDRIGHGPGSMAGLKWRSPHPNFAKGHEIRMGRAWSLIRSERYRATAARISF